jgi:hypothetical protein
MRHGFMQEVPSLATGELPQGGGQGWLAQVNYAYEGRSDIERSPFTLVLVGATRSNDYAIRVLCHDRRLGERDRLNPDSGREVVKLDDKEVRLESDGFLQRYAVSTEEELDALCAGAARIFARVVAIDGPGAVTTGEGTRRGQVERELAEHPFESPPQSIKAAAKRFRRGLVLGDPAWALGAEAFFRGQAALVGFEPIPSGVYRAGHLDTFLPGILARAARGRLATGEDAYLVHMGWTNLVVEASPMQALALASSAPRGDTAERGSMQVGADGRSLILTTLDGGRRERTAEEFGRFYAAANELVSRMQTR